MTERYFESDIVIVFQIVCKPLNITGWAAESIFHDLTQTAQKDTNTCDEKDLLGKSLPKSEMEKRRATDNLCMY